MANGVVDPPSNDAGLTAGSASGGGGSSKQRRNLIIGGVAAVGLGIIYLYAKSKSSSTANTSGTSSTPELIQPASNTDTTVGSLASSLQSQIAAEQSSLLQAMQQNNGNPIVPAEWPNIIKFGSYSPAEFTEVGTVSNGVYNGQAIENTNVPEYNNVYGGFAKISGPSQLTNGSVWVPTQYLTQLQSTPTGA